MNIEKKRILMAGIAVVLIGIIYTSVRAYENFVNNSGKHICEEGKVAVWSNCICNYECINKERAEGAGMSDCQRICP